MNARGGFMDVDFSRPAGEEALLSPDSVQWRIFKNPIAMAVGGVAAVLLEFADARIRSGVWDHSIYKIDPIGRSKRTGMVAMLGVYGPASVARRAIAGVNRMHAKVSGTTPSGETYSARDPELLDWVYATAQFGFLNAYHRFVRPVSAADKARFWSEGAPIAALYGVDNAPRSEAGFDRMLAQLLPRFEAHEINREFLDIIQSGRAAPGVPRRIHQALARASVSLLPRPVRERLELGAEYDLGRGERLLVRTLGRFADIHRDRNSPAWQAAIRLGLPGDYAWTSSAR